MAIKVKAYQCDQCESKFLRNEQEFCSSGAAYGFRPPNGDVQCPKCGSAEVQALQFNPNNLQEMAFLYNSRFRRRKGGG